VWNGVHEKSAAETSIPGNVQQFLYEAKQRFSDSQPTEREKALNKATAAIHRIATLDPQALELAENHPHVLRHVVKDAQEGE
jgi:hypothetical protein